MYIEREYVCIYTCGSFWSSSERVCSAFSYIAVIDCRSVRYNHIYREHFYVYIPSYINRKTTYI